MAVNIIRICGALLIFLCHACNESGTALGGMLGQVFNIGVPIFFVLSGYLHSRKNIPNSVGTWYWKKAKRILMPLYIFLGILAIIYLVMGYKINPVIWFQTIIPICGITQNYISGCGHLWFITHLLICYAITPLLQKHRLLTKKQMMFVFVIWFMACSLLTYMIPAIWCTLLNSLMSYVVGFYVLPHILQREYHYVLLFCTAFLSCCCRLGFRHFFDGTPFYNSVATELCSLVLALSIIVFLFQIWKLFEAVASCAAKSCIASLAERTYEFYLVHYIFLTGALKIKLPYYLQSVLVALVLSVTLALLVNLLPHFLNRKLEK